MTYPLQNNLYNVDAPSMSISNFYSLSASWLQGLAGFLTKLWPDLLALCDFQLWEDGFFKLNISWPISI